MAKRSGEECQDVQAEKVPKMTCIASPKITAVTINTAKTKSCTKQERTEDESTKDNDQKKDETMEDPIRICLDIQINVNVETEITEITTE